MQNKTTLSWILLALISLIWGSSFILIKKGLLIFNAMEVGTLRIFMASLVLLPFGIRSFRKVNVQKIPYLLIVGFVGSYIPAILFAYAQTRVDSGITGVINCFTPIFVSLIGALFFNLKMNPSSKIGLLVGLLGCLFILLGGAGFDLSGINYYGLFILAASVMYGLNVNIIKSYLPEIKALDITSISFSLVFPVCGIYLFLGTGFVSKMASSPEFIQAFSLISVLGIIGTALAMFIFNTLVKISSPVFAASCTYIIPIVAIIWGLLDGESLNLFQSFGIFIVLMGVYLANKK